MPKLNEPYYLLLIDLKDSTTVDSRKLNTMFDSLKVNLNALNQEYSDQIELPLGVHYGDEISGLFTSKALLYDVVERIREVIIPTTTFRFVVSHGHIAVDSEDIRQVG
ncbi:MAG: hypothetical protein HKN32_04000, partial [Flavobacteriales bacterium]|nr:hypothetical protein [Flavobacteriales bacterium]